MAVAPSGSEPVSLKPTTWGTSIDTGWPSIAASASMPPTPQPRTPSPLIIVVWESVPTSVSGYASVSLPDALAAVKTTRARYSRLTWWTIPVSGGTTLKFSKAFWPQRRNAYRSRLRRNSSSALTANAECVPASSTCTEWSITSSTGWSGLIFLGSPPICFIASRIAARSTIAGTPVKSWSKTRLGRKAISRSGSALGSHAARPRMSSAVTVDAVFVAQQVLQQDLERERQAATRQAPASRRASSR